MSFKDNKITTNITIDETVCQCGCKMGYLPQEINEHIISNVYFLAQNLQILVNYLQVFCRFPEYTKLYIKINSWCRCPIHNQKVGGVKDSIHLTGGAADIKIYYKGLGGRLYLDPVVISRAAFLLNKTKTTTFNGIGCYYNRVHLDVRPVDMVTWFKKKIGKFENNKKYLYGVDFTEDISFV